MARSVLSHFSAVAYQNGQLHCQKHVAKMAAPGDMRTVECQLRRHRGERVLDSPPAFSTSRVMSNNTK
eukprot:scaffold19892_cov44-Prasinocladus_malaysianus.AAC.1